jgi:hypothetical protein
MQGKNRLGSAFYTEFLTPRRRYKRFQRPAEKSTRIILVPITIVSLE